jgi:hypothetical protein
MYCEILQIIFLSMHEFSLNQKKKNIQTKGILYLNKIHILYYIQIAYSTREVGIYSYIALVSTKIELSQKL